MSDNINWTKLWSKKYPILASYQSNVKINYYLDNLNEMLDKLIDDYKLSEEDAMLVLKDILYNLYKKRRNN